MPFFRYTVLNQEQQKLTGTIEAPDEALAKTRLNTLGFSLIGFEMIQAPTTQAVDASSGTPHFEFEATDRNGKKVSGTIGAKSILAAYTRLVDEYRLNLNSITPEGTAPTQDNLATVKALYDKERKHTSGATAQEKALFEAQKKEEIAKKIDTTIERIQEFLSMHGEKLKMDEKNRIGSYINQLLRIKDSTNVEHVISTCEKMLTYIQNHEIFDEEEKRIKERTEIHEEAKQLMTNLENRGLKQEINVMDTIVSMQETPIIGMVARTIMHYLHMDNPDIASCRAKLKDINSRINSYFVLSFNFSQPKTTRIFARQTLSELKRERDQIKSNMEMLLQKIRELERVEGISGVPSLSTFLNWLLCAYLAYYFIAFPLAMKQWSFSSDLPESVFVYGAPIIKAIILFLFLYHGASSLKKLFFQSSGVAGFVIAPVTALSYILILINF
ncbi:MAG: hypothetical protein AAB592_04035 [Patescibacteria group bacterium]